MNVQVWFHSLLNFFMKKSPEEGDAAIKEIIDVPLPRPRTAETLSDALFHELARHIRATVFTRRADA